MYDIMLHKTIPILWETLNNKDVAEYYDEIAQVIEITFEKINGRIYDEQKFKIEKAIADLIKVHEDNVKSFIYHEVDRLHHNLKINDNIEI